MAWVNIRARLLVGPMEDFERGRALLPDSITITTSIDETLDRRTDIDGLAPHGHAARRRRLRAPPESARRRRHSPPRPPGCGADRGVE
jgi:hypothetical protein